MIFWKSECDRVCLAGFWRNFFFFQYGLGIVLLSSYLVSDITLVPPEHLHILASWLHPPQQPKKINQSRSETMKPDMIQEVRKRIERKLSIWTQSRAEEKPKLRSWSADSWPSFQWDNSKNYLMFSNNGSGTQKYCLKEGLIVLHTESDTNQRNVTFIDLAGIFRDLKAVLTFFMAAVSKPFKACCCSWKSQQFFSSFQSYSHTLEKERICFREIEKVRETEEQ